MFKRNNENCKLENQIYYGGRMTRDEAQALLCMDSSTGPGHFLVRYSDKEKKFVLSIKTAPNVVEHFLIHRRDEQETYYIYKFPFFPSIPLLIKHYQETPKEGLPCQLRTPCKQAAKHREEVRKVFEARINLKEDDFEIDPGCLQLIHEIGRGHFGVIQLMRWKSQRGEEREVAVKLIQSNYMNEEDFLREVRTLVNLRHPHLITVHGICTRFQPYKIVMEYMQHGSLKSFLQNHRLDLEKSVLIYMAIQIADGMEYIERQKHCHRDLRADNVLVGEHNQCKISDFGLARHLVNDMYEIKQLELPVRWTAPEAIHTKRYTIKCDVWSFGVLLTELVTYGAKPYPNLSNAEVQERTLNGYRLQREELGPNCDISIYTVMQQCWHIEPRKRPTFKDLKQMLSEYFRNGIRDEYR